MFDNTDAFHYRVALAIAERGGVGTLRSGAAHAARRALELLRELKLDMDAPRHAAVPIRGLAGKGKSVLAVPMSEH